MATGDRLVGIGEADVSKNAFLQRVQETLTSQDVEHRMSPDEWAAFCGRRDRGSSMAEVRRAETIKLCGFEGEMWDRRLESYPAKTKSQVSALRNVRGLCGVLTGPDWRSVRRGIALHGETGVGKSGLMQGFAIGVIESALCPGLLYIPCLEIDEMAKRIDLTFTAHEARIVILDDVEKGLDQPGTFRRSDGDKTIRGIVARGDRGHQQVICFTSNFGLAEHEKRFGNAWGSKLRGLAYWHEVIGSDIRPPAEEKPPWWMGD